MARLVESVLGHQSLIQRFQEAQERGHLPHTFLFVGPAGVGRRTTAVALAQILLCERAEAPCGVCSSCLRLSSSELRQTESFLLIEPEKNQIRIEQSRQILEFLSLRALRGQRAVIIDGAQTLNAQAGNALLKALEEPPEGTFFFLIAPSAAHVLPTLRSRAQIVSFQPLSLSEMRKKSKAPEWALKASQGSFERLQQLLEKEELEVRESALHWLQDWSREPLAYLKNEHRELMRDRSAARSLAHHLSWLLRDALYLKLGAPEKVLNVDKTSFLQSLIEKISLEDLLRAGEKSLWIEPKLDQNQDSSLVFEQFWIESRPGA